jgi:DNA-binding GntR family transcriptional regulator
MPIEAIRDEALTERTRAAIERAILTAELRPGAALVERTLAQQLGVSTTPVRAALRELASAGLVSLTPNRGARVQVLRRHDVEEVYSLRALLDPYAASLAADKATAEQVESMRQALVQSESALIAGSADAAAAANHVFHRGIHDAADNQRLNDILAGLYRQAQLIATFTWRYRQSARGESQEHREIFEAIERHDPALASAAALNHTVRAKRQFLLAFDAYERDYLAAAADGEW